MCACTPAFYAFDINLSNDCSSTDFITTGISDVDCAITGDLSEPLVTLTAIKITELASDFNAPPVFTNNQPNINLVDGDTHMVPSILGGNFEKQPTTYGLRIVSQGVTASGTIREMIVTIAFTNACEMEPVFVQGNKFAWFEFNEVESEPHIEKYCVLNSSAPSISHAPTISRVPTVIPPTIAAPSVDKCEGSTKASKVAKYSGKGKGYGSYSRSPTVGKGKGRGRYSSKAPKAGKGGKGGKGDGCLKTKKGKSSSKAPKAGKGKGGRSSKVPKTGKGKGKGYFQDDDMDGSYRVNRSKVFKTRRVAERVNRNNKP